MKIKQTLLAMFILNGVLCQTENIDQTEDPVDPIDEENEAQQNEEELPQSATDDDASDQQQNGNNQSEEEVQADEEDELNEVTDFAVTDCKNLKCPRGSYCKFGKCRPNINVCPSSIKEQVESRSTVCTSPRPNNSNCKDIEPVPPYGFILKVCGITASGERLYFPQGCQACKNKDVVYYMDKPCDQAPFICSASQTCQGYYCSKKGCRNDRQCPYDWQVCSSNKCVDKCFNLKCRDCKFGQCAYEQAGGACPDWQCKNTRWYCNGRNCMDKCLKRACPPNKSCVKISGWCTPDSLHKNL